MSSFFRWVSWFKWLVVEFILILYNNLFWCLLSWDWWVLLIHFSIRVEQVLSLCLLRKWFFLYFTQVIFSILLCQFLLLIVVILHVWNDTTETSIWSNLTHFYWLGQHISGTNYNSVIISSLSSWAWRIWHILISSN